MNGDESQFSSGPRNSTAELRLPGRPAGLAGALTRGRLRQQRIDLWLLAGLLLLGTAIRVWIAFTNEGVRYDIDSLYIVGRLLSSHPLHVYEALRWPYPPGYFPVVVVFRAIANATGAQFYGVIKLPAILADAGIAAALWWGVGRLGGTRPRQWAAVALVALGPSFILISGFHGQIDAFAILPALVGVIVWQLGGEHRAVIAGVLVGIGASVKTVPLFMVLAMLPTVRSRREAAVVVGIAVAIPLMSVLPFLVVDGHATLKSLTANKGIPGWGGLTLLEQPHLIDIWLNHEGVRLSGLTHFLYDQQNLIVAAAALAMGACVLRLRLPAVQAAAMIWLAVYVANPDMAYQYFVWGLPFFLLAGRTLEVAVLQLALALPAAELYFGSGLPTWRWLYTPLVDLVWLGFVVAIALSLLRLRPAARIPLRPAGLG